MGKKIQKLKRLKRIRIHREGTDTLIYSAFAIIAVAVILWRAFDSTLPFWIFTIIFGITWGIVLNFFRCPVRKFASRSTSAEAASSIEDTCGIVVAPADGKVVVIEKIPDCDYFHEPRIMVSIFMSLFNVHANWFPVDGHVLNVEHFNGNFHKAWLPKAAAENEHADVIIEATNGDKILCRQIAGAVARRIKTYASEDDDCFIDEHLGFIKFGSRVDVFLPVDSEICVKMGQATTGDQTVIAKMPIRE